MKIETRIECGPGLVVSVTGASPRIEQGEDGGTILCFETVDGNARVTIPSMEAGRGRQLVAAKTATGSLDFTGLRQGRWYWHGHQATAVLRAAARKWGLKPKLAGALMRHLGIKISPNTITAEVSGPRKKKPPAKLTGAQLAELGRALEAVRGR